MGTLPKCLRRQELLYNAGATQQGCQQMALGEADASALTENFAGFAGHFAALDIPGVGDGIPYPLEKGSRLVDLILQARSEFECLVANGGSVRVNDRGGLQEVGEIAGFGFHTSEDGDGVSIMARESPHS